MAGKRTVQCLTSLVVAGALMLICLALPTAAQKMTCAGCGKAITSGEWVQADGKTFHSQHFVCSNCRKPIGKAEYFSKDGKIYDRDCYEDLHAPKCAYCSQKLIGTFTDFEDKLYHTSCFIDHVAPRCGVCNQPLEGKYVIFDGHKYHENCYQREVAVTCSYCGGLIEGKYLKDYWGNSYHEVHKGKARECDFCQRLITPELAATSRTWSDGRSLCSICAPFAVTSPEAAESVLVVAAVKLRMHGIDVDPADVEVLLVDQKELGHLTKNGEKTIKGFTDFREARALFGLVKSRRMRIYLLFGMPETQMMYAVSHELMHVWQFLNGQIKNDKALCEGSCNYASYLVLRGMSGIEARYLIDKLGEDPDPHYGEGYRRVKSYVEKNGVSAWLEYLRTNPKAPW